MSGIKIEEKDGAVIVGISGEITMPTVSEIDIACKKYLESGAKVIALDFKNVVFIDSFGISRVIKLSKAFNAQGTDFVLINMNEHISQVFKIATFDKIFTILTNAEFEGKYLKN